MTVIGDRNHVVTMRVPCKAMQVPLRPKVSPWGLWRLVSPVSLVRMGHSFSFTDKSLIVVRGSLAGTSRGGALRPKNLSIAGSVGQCLGVFKHVLKLRGEDLTLSTLFFKAGVWEGKGELLATRNDSILFVGSQTQTGEKCTAPQFSLVMLSKWVVNVIRCESSRECYPMRIKSHPSGILQTMVTNWNQKTNTEREIYLKYLNADHMRHKVSESESNIFHGHNL